MKIIKTSLLTLVAVTALSVAGCSKPSDGAAGGASASATRLDTASFESAFQAAEPALKSAVKKAVTAIQGADYPAVVTQLQSLPTRFQLTPEQQQAVSDMIAAVQKAIGTGAGKAADAAAKAAADVPQPLGK